jgi:hypothetical protein
MTATGIDVSEVVNSPEFQQPVTLRRDAGGSFQNGKYTPVWQESGIWCVSTVASPKEIELVPEGDRNESMRVFYTTQKLNTTTSNNQVDTTGSLRDTVIHDGVCYTIVSSKWMSDYGYWKSIGARISPQ